MNRPNLTSIALSAAIALLAHAPANAANPCPNYQRNTGTSDCLYKRGVDDAAADIVWGNRTDPKRAASGRAVGVLTIDPPLPRIGPSEPPVEVLQFFRYHDYRTNQGQGPRTTWKRNADQLVERWKASLPTTVNVIRVPVAYFPGGKEHTLWAPLERLQLRMVLVGRALDIEEALDRSIIAALDRNAESFTTRAKIKTHFQAVLDVDPEAFDTTWDSTAVRQQMNHSIDVYAHVWNTSRKRAVRGFANPQQLPPVFLINGEHIVASFNIKRQRDTFRLANELITRELRQPTSSASGARWKALYDELQAVRPRDIAYNRTTAPEPGQIIELERPLKTGSGRKTIEAEWFFAYLHRGHDANRITGWLTGRMENLINPWADTVPEDDFKQLRARFTVVSQIPGHRGTTPEHARMLQELAHGWAYTENVEPGERKPTHISFPIHRAIRGHLSDYTDPKTLDSRREVNRMLRSAKIRLASFRGARASGWPKRRADAATARFNTVLDRAKAANPDAFQAAFRAPAYPIILLDGRYLITGGLAGGYTQAAQIANHIIQRLIDERKR